MEISVVVPCYNEAQVIDAFWLRLSSVMKTIVDEWEVIFINDGSRDDTLGKLISICSGSCNARYIDFSRNFGKEAAITAGLDHSLGKAIVVIDADLQHPPEVIAELVSLWRDGAEVVLCRRRTRDTDSQLRRWFSRKFYALSEHLFEVTMPKDVGDFRLMDRAVVDALTQLRESQRFMKGLFAWVGFRQHIIDFDVSDRAAGTSSFNLWKLWNFAWEGVTSFTTVPLRLWLYVGSALAVLSFAYGIFILFTAMMGGSDVPCYPSIMVMVAFIGGIQLIGIGVIGEYLGRTYRETKKRPLYIVRKTK